ncbi:MAG: hypothetical protein IJW63_06590 [Lachnospiraceae bacterium]|nr:hypothetical protein [Lachnospiraceae bacterium]
MNREELMKQILPESVSLNPIGENSDMVSPEEFEQIYPRFLDSILKIQKADISGLHGYGELDENHQPEYDLLQDFLTGTFAQETEGYWKNWKQLFETSMMTEEFFEKYYAKMINLSKYCEGQRFLVNNNTFFVNMVVSEQMVGFLDWSRAGVMDWLLDFAIMDLNKPYLLIPEKLYAYLKDKGVEVKHFKERFLCMAYYKGLDTLRWHASIDDTESCKTIIQSISELEERMNRL